MRSVVCCLSLAVALVASLVLVWPIFGRYHLATVNPYPSESPSTHPRAVRAGGSAPRLSRETRLPDRGGGSLRLPLAPTTKRPRDRCSSRGRRPCCSCSPAPTCAYLLRKVAIVVPTPVPTYHVLFHGMALVSLGFGDRGGGARASRGPAACPAGEWTTLLPPGWLRWPSPPSWWSSWDGCPHSRRHDATEVREWALSFDKDHPGRSLRLDPRLHAERGRVRLDATT